MIISARIKKRRMEWRSNEAIDYWNTNSIYPILHYSHL